MPEEGKQTLCKSWGGAGLVSPLTPKGSFILERDFIDKVERKRKKLLAWSFFQTMSWEFMFGMEKWEKVKQLNLSFLEAACVGSNGSSGDWTQCKDVWGPNLVPWLLRQQMNRTWLHMTSPSSGTHTDYTSAPSETLPLFRNSIKGPIRGVFFFLIIQLSYMRLCNYNTNGSFYFFHLTLQYTQQV